PHGGGEGGTRRDAPRRAAGRNQSGGGGPAKYKSEGDGGPPSGAVTRLMERRLVLPGDPIAAAEEYEAGEGTYEREGEIYAATPGMLELDGQNFVARVRPFNPRAGLKTGDVVYGGVSETRSSKAAVPV